MDSQNCGKGRGFMCQNTGARRHPNANPEPDPEPQAKSNPDPTSSPKPKPGLYPILTLTISLAPTLT